jgi:SsrA-binding protein
MKDSRTKIVARNRRASHDYELLDRFEAGLVLSGSEIKSVRAGQVSLKRGFVIVKSGELWLVEAHIAPYEHAGYSQHEPTRPRKLLLHRREIETIINAITIKGLTMVPTKMYLRDGWAKIEVALARGKKKYDKRADLAKKDAKRQVERALRQKYGR